MSFFYIWRRVNVVVLTHILVFINAHSAPPMPRRGETYLTRGEYLVLKSPEGLIQTSKGFRGSRSFENIGEGRQTVYFSYGVSEQGWKNRPGSFEFSVRVSISGRPVTVIFRDTLSPQNVTEHRGWKNTAVDFDIPKNATGTLSFQAAFSVGGVSNPSNGDMVWGGIRIGDFNRKTDELNIILISLDTLRADRLGCYGYERATSRHIDQLAKNGVVFEQAFSHSSWTKPAHASLFTGLYPITHGMNEPDILRDQAQTLPSSIPLLTEILAQNGYITHAITGSAYVSSCFGFNRGFDQYIETVDRQDSDAHVIFPRGIKWLEKNSKNKFFLFLHSYEIHEPHKHSTFLDHLKKTSSMEKLNALYDGDVFYTDQFIGQLMETLKLLRLDKKTLVILTSDHGQELMQHGYFLGHGHTLYDELIRIPLIFHAPSHLQPRRVANYQAQLVDILPTLLDLLGIKQPGLLIHGSSLAPMMKGSEEPTESYSFSEMDRFGGEIKAVRYRGPEGEYKLVVAYQEDKKNKKKRGPYRYWLDLTQKNNGSEFFDLRTDPKELVNLPNQDRPMRQRLQQQMNSYLSLRPRPIKKGETKPKFFEDVLEKLKSLGY